MLASGVSVPYTTWDKNFSALANAGYRVLRFDYYGRGYSDRPGVVYDLALLDRQILELLTALKLNEPITPVGLSMGGAVVTTFAARHPERTRRLILIGPLLTPPSSLPIRLVRAPGIGERVFDWFGNKILVGGQAQDFYKTEFVAAYQTQYRVPMKYRGFKRAILSTIRSMPTWKIKEAYEQVGKADYPVLLLWGRHDKTILFETHPQVQALIPHAKFHAIEDAGHVVHLEQAEVVNRLVMEFMKK